MKAIEAAIQAKQWTKAVQIVELQDDEVVDKLVLFILVLYLLIILAVAT